MFSSAMSAMIGLDGAGAVGAAAGPVLAVLMSVLMLTFC